MRALSPSIDEVVPPGARAPRVGSYRGGLGRVDWSRVAGHGRRLAGAKKWVYVAVATDDVYVALAIVRLGYASYCFAYAYDAAARRMLARRTWMAAPWAADVADRGGDGCRASFVAAGVRARAEPLRGARVESPELDLDVLFDDSSAPPALGAVAELAPGRFDATEKRALLTGRGRLRVAGRTIPLDGALAGYDFTSGLLPRRTRWRWGFALGRDAGGRPLALNLVEGWVGEAECAVWVDGDVLPLAEGRFAFDPRRPEDVWTVTTADGAARLAMTPGAVHREAKDLLVVRSRFVQPCGAWSGSIALPDRPPIVIGRALGVTEDQDVTW
jgi:hypothetical protein